jgi:putative SOS response-associated peptidase YedK
MCGRFILTLDAPELEKEFGIRDVPADWQPRYNIAPTQPIPAVIDPESKKIELIRWGLIPSWAKDPSIGSRLINARAETLAEKPSFRKAFQERRCIILSDGFFEWQRIPGSRGPSIPYVFRRKEGLPFAFAGLWEVWKHPDGAWLKTCTIITCAANEVVRPIHDRMPVMMNGSEAWNWLSLTSRKDLEAMLQPYPADEMVSYQVSTQVNRPDPDHPDMIKPILIQ